MGEIACNPYLFFDGNYRDAINFYQGVFGGGLSIHTYGGLTNEFGFQ